MMKNDLEDMFQEQLNEKTLEDILEKYDLTPLEALMILFNLGYIDEVIVERSKDEE